MGPRCSLATGKAVEWRHAGRHPRDGLMHRAVTGQVRDVNLGVLLFIAANLTLGLLIPTLVQTRFQALQMKMFFFLPSILLSGFMFPPRAAQYIAELLPPANFVCLIRGIMLRGAEPGMMAGELYALAAFLLVNMEIAVLRFSKRLD